MRLRYMYIYIYAYVGLVTEMYITGAKITPFICNSDHESMDTDKLTLLIIRKYYVLSEKRVVKEGTTLKESLCDL